MEKDQSSGDGSGDSSVLKWVGFFLVILVTIGIINSKILQTSKQVSASLGASAFQKYLEERLLSPAVCLHNGMENRFLGDGLKIDRIYDQHGLPLIEKIEYPNYSITVSSLELIEKEGRIYLRVFYIPAGAFDIYFPLNFDKINRVIIDCASSPRMIAKTSLEIVCQSLSGVVSTTKGEVANTSICTNIDYRKMNSFMMVVDREVEGVLLQDKRDERDFFSSYAEIDFEGAKNILNIGSELYFIKRPLLASEIPKAPGYARSFRIKPNAILQNGKGVTVSFQNLTNEKWSKDAILYSSVADINQLMRNNPAIGCDQGIRYRCYGKEFEGNEFSIKITGVTDVKEEVAAWAWAQMNFKGEVLSMLDVSDGMRTIANSQVQFFHRSASGEEEWYYNSLKLFETEIAPFKRVSFGAYDSTGKFKRCSRNLSANIPDLKAYLLQDSELRGAGCLSYDPADKSKVEQWFFMSIGHDVDWH